MPNNVKIAGTVVSVQRCPGYRKPMQVVEETEVIMNLGIKNDVHALPDSSRQVLLLEKETLDTLGLQPGEVKENITTTGIQLMMLKHHDRLKIGNDVVLEVTKACAPCSRMEELRPGLLRELAGRRGMLARVLTGGTMRRGDSITLAQ
jgi:MOSC domain-containing protein YiiM